MDFYADPRFWLWVTTFAPFALALALYGVRSPWQGSPVGRSLFMLLASLSAVLLFGVLAVAVVLPEALLSVLRFVLVGGVQVAGWVFLVQVIRLQRTPRRRSTDH